MKGVNNFYNNIFSGWNIREVKRSSTNVHFFYKLIDLFKDTAAILNLLDLRSIMGCTGGTRSVMGSLSNSVFERRTSCIIGRWFGWNSQVNPPYKRKETYQYKFLSVKAYSKGEDLTSGWRASLKNVCLLVLFGQKRELQCIFLGKKAIIITSKHGTTIFFFSHNNLFLGKLKEKLESKRTYWCEYIGSCSCPLGIP